MYTSVELSNCAANSISLKNYSKATSLLNKALLTSNHLQIGQHSSFQDYEKVKEEEPHIEYDEGMNKLPEPFLISPTKVYNNNFVKLVIFYNLGIAHSRSRNNEDALAYFEKALSENITLRSFNVIARNNYFGTEETIALLHNLGHAYFRCQRFDESLEVYNRALEFVLQTYNYYHLHVSSILNCIGVVRLHTLNEKNDTQEVLGVLTEALAINQAIFSKGQGHILNATIMNNIGRVRFVRGEYNQAKAMYEESYKIRQSLYGDSHIDVAAIFYNMGEVYHSLGNLDEAVCSYQQFLNIVLVKNGQNNFDAVLALKKVGDINYDRKEYDKAIETYVKALNIVKELLGENHTEVASILNKIGNICYERQELDMALQIYEEGLKVEREIFDPDHPNIVITIINIARIHHQKANLDEALKLHKEALAIQKRSCSNGSDRLNAACTLSSIGLLHDQRKQYGLAIDVFKEALEIRTQELGEGHFDISSTFNVS